MTFPIVSGGNIAVRYPAGPITPQGACYLMSDRIPMMAYRSYDDTAVFNLSGALSIADRTMPETIKIVGLKGLIPPWQNISQKGATQDGATYVTSLYDPIDVELEVYATGRDPQHLRQVVRDWVESWDAKQPGELSWTTAALGRWWARVRWDKQPADKWQGGNHRFEKFTMVAKAYNGFWQTWDDVDTFGFAYTAASDGFNFVTTGTGTSSDLGSGWTCAYSGSALGGWIQATNNVAIFGILLDFPIGGQAVWVNDPGHTISAPGRDVVCRRNSFSTATNNQVINMQLGSFPELGFPSGAYNDLWGWMATSGTPGTTGIRARFGVGTVALDIFNGGVDTPLASCPLIVPPYPGEWWQLVLGYAYNANLVTVQRNGCTVLQTVVPASLVIAGSANRGAGFGMHAGQAGVTQPVPATVLAWGAGDNATQAQSGFLQRVNAGDQPMFDRITCYGPGTFTIADGPGSQNSVSFGPLLDGQVMQLRTDPNKRAVVDLTGTPPPPQQLAPFQQALSDFISFATAGNVPPLLVSIESAFGVTPAQGNPYQLLNGRFSDNAAIPPKPPGQQPPTYELAVSITNGNADSRIVAAGTPLRRAPY